VIKNYLKTQKFIEIPLINITKRQGHKKLIFTSGKVFSRSTQFIEAFQDIVFFLEYKINDFEILNYTIDIGINNYMGDRVAWLSSNLIENDFDIANNSKIEFCIKNFPLSPGEYSCNIFCKINNEISDWLTEVMHFSVIQKDYYNTGKIITQSQGSVLLDYKINKQ
jgi:lipopolysaccharide transport system ATP-binding protein